ncbi:protein of unknown function (plasmid) [Cupriavidus taiwanensis]|uniref:Uncharacterized protein n=1 Tax=Cupriavidus taiwanensis TaxID=164546 RepID=A0A375IS99_9BURK|nr:protein of unknown function [Cupriavidus taiwanensis]
MLCTKLAPVRLYLHIGQVLNHGLTPQEVALHIATIALGSGTGK